MSRPGPCYDWLQCRCPCGLLGTVMGGISKAVGAASTPWVGLRAVKGQSNVELAVLCGQHRSPSRDAHFDHDCCTFRRAFEAMKRALLDKLKLWVINLDIGFVLCTDASDYAIGAVLEQVEDNGTHVPVAFGAESLLLASSKLGQPDLGGSSCMVQNI